MNTIQVIQHEPLVTNKLFAGSLFRTNYLWKNLVIEKRIAVKKRYLLYKGSLLDDFWSVLSSPLN